MLKLRSPAASASSYSRRNLLLMAGAAGLSAATLGAGAAYAQDAFPARPIRIVVTFPPGGGPDTAARIVAAKMSALTGHNVYVENRAGATGIIGADHVAKAAPDGYTVMVATPGAVTIAPASGRRLAYGLNDFAGVTQGVLQTPILVVAPDATYQTVADLIAAAQAKPGVLNFGSAGIGNSQHLAGELFNQVAGIKTLHVPYAGTAQALVAVMNKEVDFFFSDPAAMPHIKAGKLRALAVSTTKRSPNLPNVPTVAESGLPGYEYSNWYGFVVPAKTPLAIIHYLNREITRALNDADVQSTLKGAGMETAPSSPEELNAYMATDLDKWSKVIRTANIKFD